MWKFACYYSKRFMTSETVLLNYIIGKFRKFLKSSIEDAMISLSLCKAYAYDYDRPGTFAHKYRNSLMALVILLFMRRGKCYGQQGLLGKLCSFHKLEL